eukprot:6260-Heterocapsa_arctica.AAC.1
MELVNHIANQIRAPQKRPNKQEENGRARYAGTSHPQGVQDGHPADPETDRRSQQRAVQRGQIHQRLRARHRAGPQRGGTLAARPPRHRARGGRGEGRAP